MNILAATDPGAAEPFPPDVPFCSDGIVPTRAADVAEFAALVRLVGAVLGTTVVIVGVVVTFGSVVVIFGSVVLTGSVVVIVGSAVVIARAGAEDGRATAVLATKPRKRRTVKGAATLTAP